MSEHGKRQLDLSSESSSSSSSLPKRRAVQKRTVDHWMSQCDKQFDGSSMTWLIASIHVSTLRCFVCSQFKRQLESMRNFRSAIIDSTTYVRISTVKDHAGADMHVTRERTKRKFDITYMLVKEKLAFTKMASVCQLEERHGVNLGAGYKNDQTCATFVKYIACDQQNTLQSTL